MRAIVTAIVLLAILSAGLLLGCGATTGLVQWSPEVQAQQIEKCGPDGEPLLEKYDKLCGRCCIDFEREGDTEFPPTAVTEVEIFKNTNHFEGSEPKVMKEEAPTRPYVVVGKLKFPTRWYYSTTINAYLLEKLSEVGAHAVLAYDTFQDGAQMRKSEKSGEMLNVYHMKMEAIVIRYTDEG